MPDYTKLAGRLGIGADPDDFDDIKPLGSLEVDGQPVYYEVWGTIDAVVETKDGTKRIPRLVGPIKLARDQGLFQAMSILSFACHIPEYQASHDELFGMAPEIARRIEEGEYNWE